MEPTFKEYSSIENVERTKEINTIIQQGKAGGEWVVTEKVHGANFAFYVSADDIKCAKRTSNKSNSNPTDWLTDDSKFFNYQDIRDRLAPMLRHMFQTIKQELAPDMEYMTLYGELFGGNYPHPLVERSYMAMCVQKGVYYHPGNQFMAFDLVLHSDTYHSVQSHGVLVSLCSRCNVHHVPVLFKGTFQECLEYSNEFQTKVPEMFGLPPIEDNTAEGVVIKPCIPDFFWNSGRIILKNKNAKWSEKAHKERPNKQKDANALNKFDFEPTQECQDLLAEIMTYLTENRLRNVLSKMEKITDRQFGMIVGNMNRDVMDEFLKDFKDRFVALEEKERKMITKRMGNASMELIRSNFLNILDGNF